MAKFNNKDVILMALKGDKGDIGFPSVSTSSTILALTEDKGIYIATDTGHWYYWNGTQYADGGVYQATEIADKSVTYSKRNADIAFNELNFDLLDYTNIPDTTITIDKEIAGYDTTTFLPLYYPRTGVTCVDMSVGTLKSMGITDVYFHIADSPTINQFIQYTPSVKAWNDTSRANEIYHIALGSIGEQERICFNFNSVNYKEVTAKRNMQDINTTKYLTKFIGSADLKDGVITNDKLGDGVFKGGGTIQNNASAPLNDANTLPNNSMYTLGAWTTGIENTPVNEGVIIDFSPNVVHKQGTFQLLVSKSNRLFTRIAWGQDGGIVWTNWKEYTDGGSTPTPPTPSTGIETPLVSVNMFKRIGAIGDSYTAASIVREDGEWDGAGYTAYIAVMGKRAGVEYGNYGSGGKNTRTYQNENDGLSWCLAADPCDFYFLALGINDVALGESYIGSVSDIHDDDYTQNADTFYGNYGKIIQQVKNHAPNARFIMVKLMAAWNENFNAAIEGIAEHYGFPVIDPMSDPFFQSSTYKDKMVGGHPTVVSYSGMGLAFERLFSKCVIENYDYFKFSTVVGQ